MRKINIKNKLINLALSHSFWVTHFNSGSCSGCDIEILTLFTPRYDLERWGISLRSTPRHTDGLLVTGPLTNQSISHLLRAYSQMPEPRFVFCVGTCACTGGVYQECYNIQTGVDKFIPVALYIPGCPP
ncbi:MAG: NADH-quinone oxidoreductase subunit B family protein, partial [Promethearchaeota archaeon]